MRLGKVIRLASDNDTVHGLRQFHEAQTKEQRSLWVAYLTGAVVLLLCVVFPVTSKYIRNERLVEVSLQIPVTLPTLSICPVRIPEFVARRAGYSTASFKKLESAINYQTWTDVNSSKHQFDHEPVFAQEMLHRIARVHFEMLNITSKRSMVDMLPLLQVNDTLLNPTGYCLRYKSPRTPSAISAIRARFMFHEVKINNKELFEESNRMRIVVGHDRDLVVLPGGGIFIGNHRLSARWLTTEVVNPRKRDCSSTHHSLEHCYVDCMTEIPCEGNCELLSPFKNQTVKALCKGRDAVRCLRTSRPLSDCFHACKKPCLQSLYTISNVAETPISDHDIKFDMIVESPDSSLSVYEIPFSTPSVYFAYLCNGLGVFLGVHLHALVTLSQLFLISGTKLERRISPKHLTVLVYVLLLVLSVPFLVSLTNDYFFEEKTAATISMDRQNISTTILIVGPSLSEQKLKNLLNLSNEFWDEDDELRVSHPELPTMCDLVAAPMWSHPTLYKFDVSNTNVIRRVEQLSAILANTDYVKRYGIRNLLLNSIEDASGVFVNVTNEAGEALNYTTQIVVASNLNAFAIKIDNRGSSTFLQGDRNEFTIRTNRHSTFENKCRAMRKQNRGLLAAGEVDTIYMSYNYLVYPRDVDIKVNIIPVRSILKDSRKHRCSKTREEYNRCIDMCYGRLLPCECELILYNGQSKYPVVRNMSSVCHRLVPVAKQCVMLRALHDQTLAECDWLCPGPCVQNSYHMQSKNMPMESRSLQRISVTIETKSTQLHIEEHFVYNFVIFVCSTGSVFSFIFGYSFITLFLWLQKLASAVNRAGCCHNVM